MDTPEAKMFRKTLNEFLEQSKEQLKEKLKMKRKIKLRDMTAEQFNDYVTKCKMTCTKCAFQNACCRCSIVKDSWVNNKDLYSDKFLNQEVEIDIPNILTKEEKEYLANVIKPFKDKVISISKKQTANLINLGFGGYACRSGYYINIQVKDDFFTNGFQNIELVRFEENTMYQGMKTDKKYTLTDLGLTDKITLKQFWKSKEKLAIHCDTEEKANKLSRAFDKMGKKWADGSRYISNNCWDATYKKDTCYSNAAGYCRIDWYKENGWKIYEFEDVDF